jgi:hypothetical protein
MPYKVADVDILIVPGWSGAGPDHWQSRWARNLKTAQLVEQADWLRPQIEDWVARIVAAVDGASRRPAVIVAHGCGACAVVHAAPRLDPRKVAGAFLVAPPDLAQTVSAWPTEDGRFFPAEEGCFAPVPADPLSFPSLLVASRNDPFAAFERSQGFALDWGSDLADAGPSGHINTASGHGPWPEGLLKLGQFLKRLG